MTAVGVAGAAALFVAICVVARLNPRRVDQEFGDVGDQEAYLLIERNAVRAEQRERAEDGWVPARGGLTLRCAISHPTRTGKNTAGESGPLRCGRRRNHLGAHVSVYVDESVAAVWH